MKCSGEKVRQDTIDYNDERIEKTRDKNELWKVVNDNTKNSSVAKWKLEENGEEIKDEKEIADIFNGCFIEQIGKLK